MKIINLTILIYVLTSIMSMSCSDNISSIYMNKPEMNTSGAVNKTFLWGKDELKIRANGERIVYDDAKYSKGDVKVTNIEITYDGYTNADTSTYDSKVSILGDNVSLFTESGEQYIIRHHILEFNIPNINQIRFYIALWCDGWKEYCSSATLKISNLKIYQIN